MLLILGAGLFAVASCDKVPLTAPSGSTLTLFANTTVVPVNGTAEITATVIESGGTIAHNGTVVTFTTTIGTIDPAEARTRDGKATVRLHAGTRSGRAFIRAFSGGTTTEEDLTIDIGGAAAGRIALAASPTAVPSTGGSSVLTAVVFDVDGNVLPGVPVAFTATTGTIAQSVVVSDGNGQASTTITTNRDSTVTATAGGRAEGQAVTAQVTITAVAQPTVSVSVTTTTPTVGQPVVFSVNATAPAPSSIRSVTIDFGDGSSQSLGAISTATNVPHTYRSAGTFPVTVRAEDTNGAIVTASTAVVVSPSVPVLVGVTVQAPTTPQANPIHNVGETISITITADRQGNPSAVQRITVDWGDGETQAIGGLQGTHVYQRAATFLIRVTVTLTDGASGTGTAAVQVFPP
jgi:hypothetical protein